MLATLVLLGGRTGISFNGCGRLILGTAAGSSVVCTRVEGRLFWRWLNARWWIFSDADIPLTPCEIRFNDWHCSGLFVTSTSELLLGRTLLDVLVMFLFRGVYVTLIEDWLRTLRSRKRPSEVSTDRRLAGLIGSTLLLLWLPLVYFWSSGLPDLSLSNTEGLRWWNSSLINNRFSWINGLVCSEMSTER